MVWSTRRSPPLGKRDALPPTLNLSSWLLTGREAGSGSPRQGTSSPRVVSRVPRQRRSSGGLPCQDCEQYARLLRIGCSFPLRALYRVVSSPLGSIEARVPDAAPETPVPTLMAWRSILSPRSRLSLPSWLEPVSNVHATSKLGTGYPRHTGDKYTTVVETCVGNTATLKLK